MRLILEILWYGLHSATVLPRRPVKYQSDMTFLHTILEAYHGPEISQDRFAYQNGLYFGWEFLSQPPWLTDAIIGRNIDPSWDQSMWLGCLNWAITTCQGISDDIPTGMKDLRGHWYHGINPATPHPWNNVLLIMQSKVGVSFSGR